MIDEAIYEHPAVEEVCVTGIPDAYRGRLPTAFIKLKQGVPGLTLDETKELIKDRVDKHEMVQAMELPAELPKTTVGKLSKKEVVDKEARESASAKA